MDDIVFSWDDKKARQNIRKHGVSFEEASTVFFDENAIEFFDPDHSLREVRYLMLGISDRLRILVVSYCLRKEGSKIRIISARRATKKNKKFIQEENYEKRIRFFKDEGAQKPLCKPAKEAGNASAWNRCYQVL